MAPADRPVLASYLEVEARLGGAFLHPGGRDLTRYLLRALDGEPRPLRVLEVGCGTGSSTALVAALPGVEVVALERSAAMLAAAQRRLASAPQSTGPARLVRADANHPLPCASGSFGAAYAESVVALLDVRRALAELARVLRPGALLAINERIWRRGLTAEQVAEVNAASWRAFGIPAATPAPWHCDDWVQLLQEAGFQQVTALPVDSLLTQRAPAWHLGQRAARLRRYGARPALLRRSLRFKADSRREAQLWARMECYLFLARRAA